MVYSAYSLHKICIPLHCSWSVKTPMSSKRILNVDLSYSPIVNFFIYILENKSPFQILG